MLAQGNQRVAVHGPNASLNSLVGASPAKPRQLFAAAFRPPKGRRTLSQSTLRPILSLAQSYHRAGRAGKPIPNLKSHRDSYKIDGCIQQLCGGSCFQTASYCLSFLLSAFRRLPDTVRYLRSVERPEHLIKGFPLC